MAHKTVAVIGIGFAPKRNSPKKQQRGPTVRRGPRSPEHKDSLETRPEQHNSPESDPTDSFEMAGETQMEEEVGRVATKAIVGIGFAPKKS